MVRTGRLRQRSRPVRFEDRFACKLQFHTRLVFRYSLPALTIEPDRSASDLRRRMVRTGRGWKGSARLVGHGEIRQCGYGIDAIGHTTSSGGIFAA
jgi:hypothetical protein